MHPVVPAGTLSPWEPGITSMVIYCLLVLMIMGIFLFLCGRFADRKANPEKLRPYECGIIPTGLAHFRYPVPFFLVAVFFLIFDIEAIFIFSWAIAFGVLGWIGWLQMSFFIMVLLVSLFYIWSKGGLEWGPKASNKALEQQY